MIIFKNMEQLKKELENKNINIWEYQYQENESTLLHISIMSQSLKIVNLILQIYEDDLRKSPTGEFVGWINQKNKFELTPIQLSCCVNSQEILLSLLEHGADPSIRGRNGFTCAHYCVENDNPKSLYILMEFIDIFAKNDQFFCPFQQSIYLN